MEVEWVSISECVPDNARTVWVYASGESLWAYVSHTADGLVWHTGRDDLEGNPERITHWAEIVPAEYRRRHPRPGLYGVLCVVSPEATDAQ